MIFARATREPAHSNSCDPLSEKAGRPCYRILYVTYIKCTKWTYGGEVVFVSPSCLKILYDFLCSSSVSTELKGDLDESGAGRLL